jgi:hypothetical protein
LATTRKHGSSQKLFESEQLEEGQKEVLRARTEGLAIRGGTLVGGPP